MTQNYLKL